MKLTKAQKDALDVLPYNGYKSANALGVQYSVLSKLRDLGLAECIAYNPVDWNAPSKRIVWRRKQ